MTGEKLPQSGKSEGLAQIARIPLCFAVGLACQGENGIGAGFDAAGNQPCEVHTEERKFGIGHRINKMAHESRGLGAEPVIFSTEGNNAVGRIEPGEAADAVALQTGAIDEEVAGEITNSGFGCPTIRGLTQTCNSRSRHHAAAHGQKVIAQ